MYTRSTSSCRRYSQRSSNATYCALSSFSAEWKNKTGSSSLPKWPVTASKHEGNAGVAIGIRVTPYSIGYIDVADAKTHGVAYAKIANAEGQYIAPTLEAVQAATNAFGSKLEALAKNGSTNFYVDAVDPKGEPAAYPISTFTYIAFNPSALDCPALFDVMYLSYWAWTDQQASEIAFQHQLAPSPVALRSVLRTAFRAIECHGGPAGKFKSFLLSHVEYHYKPVIVGAGATFP